MDGKLPMSWELSETYMYVLLPIMTGVNLNPQQRYKATCTCKSESELQATHTQKNTEPEQIQYKKKYHEAAKTSSELQN